MVWYYRLVRRRCGEVGLVRELYEAYLADYSEQNVFCELYEAYLADYAFKGIRELDGQATK